MLSRGAPSAEPVRRRYARQAPRALSMMSPLPRGEKLEYKGTIFEEMDSTPFSHGDPSGSGRRTGHTNIPGSKHASVMRTSQELLAAKST